MGKCSFNKLWLENPKYASWLLSVTNDQHKAKCCVCMKYIDISSMGEAALSSHIKGKKHLQLLKGTQQQSTLILNFMKPTDQAATATAPTTTARSLELVASTTSSTTSMPTNKSTLDTYVTREDTLTAEITWALKVIDCHYSYNSSIDTAKLFQKMFPDSQIAKQFSCGEKKCAYLTCFGLAPHFKEELIKLLKNEDNYVVLFDESMNAVTQSKQLDVHVRAWNTNKLLVESRYYNSVFMGHGTAADMMMHFRDAVEGLEIPKIFQISMDGPNVNWRFYKDFCEEMSKDFDCQSLNIGSCGLHILNNAFKAGGEASSWGIEQLFSSAHWLFHDTPARREDFQKITGNTKFPLKFCKHRWLENVPVAERIQEILPDIAKYVKSAKAQQVSCPKTKSFEVIVEAMKDPLLEAKLAFFTLVAKEVYPFWSGIKLTNPCCHFWQLTCMQS
ncbi:hypothetical protein BSL78_10820 [Apostichopus japonicus]|uniref:BED-type domain-containing protein n=1 Tax=Stichopus japonicus TaxID=307972 RepID=A0A2G8KW86_STIJA|nr:hypothetical protein BSL78_10820 [Apostichopus japonicus]